MDNKDLYKLRQKQSLPLEVKIEMSKRRIQEWYDRFDGQVYVSFSGGKDSTVLLHLVRSIYPHVPAVYIRTGLEYPEIEDFVKTIDNVTILKPTHSFKEVIQKYGYPVVSKEQSSFIEEYRNSKSERLKDIRLNGNKWSRGKISKRWLYLLEAPFKISAKCCDIMKKNPAKSYEKKTGNKAFIGTMACESALRTQSYLKHGCNAFDMERPVSRPLSIWTEEDIWTYLKEYKVDYSKIYDKGYERTGCMFCLFGCHNEKPINRFERMYYTHPKLYEYCMYSLGIAEVLDYMNIKYIPIETKRENIIKKDFSNIKRPTQIQLNFNDFLQKLIL